MTTRAVLVVTLRARAGKEDEVSEWRARHYDAVSRFSGFTAIDMIPPRGERGGTWTVLVNFRSRDALTRWQDSKEHASLLAEGNALFEEGSYGESVRTSDGNGDEAGPVTEVIFSKVVSGREHDYREWSARIQEAQSRVPGYRGTFLQPPAEPGGMWTTILRFDTAAELEEWMHAPERAAMLEEAKAFVEHEQLTRLATSFPGWVPSDPKTGSAPPDWKGAMLVLLGLFPIVMLEMKYLSPVWAQLGIHAALATFVGNSISVALTSFLTMPLCVRAFRWWLFPEPNRPWVTARGIALLSVLYAAEVASLWALLPW